MALRQREIEIAFSLEKRMRALYSLQQIPAARLVEVINGVLSGKELLTNIIREDRER